MDETNIIQGRITNTIHSYPPMDILNFIGNKLLSASLAANPRHLHDLLSKSGQGVREFHEKPKDIRVNTALRHALRAGSAAQVFAKPVLSLSKDSWLKRLFTKKSNA